MNLTCAALTFAIQVMLIEYRGWTLYGSHQCTICTWGPLAFQCASYNLDNLPVRLRAPRTYYHLLHENFASKKDD